jgi:hypothetical protein
MKKVYLILLWIWLAFTAMAQQSSVFQGTYNSGQHTIYHSSLVTDTVNPTVVSQDAKVELRAATSIRLLPGFRAGGFTPGNGGYFLARLGLGGSRKDTAICKGQQIQLGDSAELNVSYAWSPSIGLNDTTLSNPLANPDSTTMYLVLKTYPNGRVEIDTMVVLVNPLPVANAGSDEAFCAGGSVGLSASASGGTPSYTYAWSPSTGLSSATMANPTASPTVNTTYTLVVTDSLGCNANDTVNIIVNQIGSSSTCPEIVNSLDYLGLNKELINGVRWLKFEADSELVNILVKNDWNLFNPARIIDTKLYSSNNLQSYIFESDTIDIGTSNEQFYSFFNDTTVLAYYLKITASDTGRLDTIAISQEKSLVGPAIPCEPVGNGIFAGAAATNIGQSSVTFWSNNTGSADSREFPIGDIYIQLVGNQFTQEGIRQQISLPQGFYNIFFRGGCWVNPTSQAGGQITLNIANQTIGFGPMPEVRNSIVNPTVREANRNNWGDFQTCLINLNDWVGNMTLTASSTVAGIQNTVFLDNFNICDLGLTTDIQGTTINQDFYCQNVNLTNGFLCQCATDPTTNATLTWITPDGTFTGFNVNYCARTSGPCTLRVNLPSGCFLDRIFEINVPPAPTPLLSGPPIVCPNSIQTYSVLNNSDSDLGNDYQAGTIFNWYVNGSLIPEQSDLSETFNYDWGNTAGGSICVKAVYPCPNLCESSEECLNVTVISTPNFDAGMDVQRCIDGDGVVIGPAPNTELTYAWSPSNGLSCTTCAQPTATPTGTTTYTLDVNLVNGAISCAFTSDIVVTVNPLPYVNAGDDLSICRGQSTTLAGVATSEVPITDYFWTSSYEPLDTDPYQASADVSPIENTTYTLTVTDANGCSASDDVLITVLNLPSVYAGLDQTICSGSTTQLTGSGTGVISWSPINSLSSTTTLNPISTPLGTTTYTLTITGVNGCSNSDEVTISLIPLPPQSQNFYSVCRNGSITLDATVLDGVSYQWSILGQGSTYLSPPNPTGATALLDLSGNSVPNNVNTLSYSVLITYQNGCSNTNYITVGIQEPPIIQWNNNVLLCQGTSQIMPISYINAATNAIYNWTPNTGLNSASNANPLVGPSQSTTYSVSVTNPNGCSSSFNNCFVEVVPPIVGSISSSDEAMCPGESITLTAPTGNYYIWTGPQGNNYPHSQTISVNQPGTYNVAVYHGNAGYPNQCSQSFSISVNNYPVPNSPVIYDNIYQGSYCSAIDGPLIVSVIPQFGETFTWVNPSTTGTSISVTPIVNSTYEVYSTNIFGCQSNSSFFTIAVDCPPCAETGRTYVRIPPTTAANAIPIGSLQGNYLIEGVWNITGTYGILNNSDIIMAAGSEINVQGTLNVSYSNIRGCDKLWKGITIADGATLNIKNSTVSDAYVAVDVGVVSTVISSNNTFSNNYIGIKNRAPSPLNVSNFVNLLIYNCIFDGGNPINTGVNGALLPHYSNTNQPINYMARIGMDLNKIDIPLTINSNRFKNLCMGIRVNDCNITINQTSFENILNNNINYESGLGYNYNGAAMVISNSFYSVTNLTQIGFGAVAGSSASFNNCDIGIFSAKRVNLDISKNTMLTMRKGIISYGNFNTTQKINKNSIWANSIGIGLLQPDGNSTLVDISKNALYIGSATAGATAGIMVSCFNSAKGIKIEQNLLEINKSKNGIYVLNGSGINVNSNTLNMNETVPSTSFIPRYGIYIGGNNSTYASYLCNFIDGSNGGRAKKIGIFETGSIQNCIVRNQVDQTMTGMGFVGTCSNTLLLMNQFLNHDIALKVSTGATIGTQFFPPGGIFPQYFGNKWSGTCINEAFNQNGILPLTATSQIRVNWTSGAIYVPNPFLPNTSNWVTQVQFGSTWNTTSNCSPFDASDLWQMALFLSPSDSLIAQDSLVYPEYPETHRWSNQKNLAFRLLHYKPTINGNMLFQSFIDSTQNQSAGKYAVHSMALDTVLNVESSGPKDSLQYMVDSLLTEITTLDSLIGLDSIFSNDSLFLEQKFERSEHVSSLQLQLNNIYSKDYGTKTNRISSLSNSYTVLVDTAEFEWNEKQVVLNYLNTVAKGNLIFDSTEIDLIYFIANQCPERGGNAVFKARSLYSQVNDTLTYDDSTLCETSQFRLDQFGINQNPNHDPNLILIFPNPTNDKLNIKVLGQFEGEMIYNVKDLVGHLLLEGKLGVDLKEYQINLNGLNQGVYLLEILNQNKPIRFEKIIKQ